jgi:hypothetical protein
MIKSNELRIGNLYNQYGDIHQVNGHVISALEKAPQGQLWCKPIPLTEEWLLKFGFEKQMMWTYAINIIGNKKLIYYLGEKGWSVGNKNYSDFSNLNYVHQLQNLYFALTNQELEIKK